MSRRRASWQPSPAIESDTLLAAMFGEQHRQEPAVPVAGCTARCCAPLPVVESRFWRGIVVGLTSEIVGVLAVLALIVAASRGLGW